MMRIFCSFKKQSAVVLQSLLKAFLWVWAVPLLLAMSPVRADNGWVRTETGSGTNEINLGSVFLKDDGSTFTPQYYDHAQVLYNADLGLYQMWFRYAATQGDGDDKCQSYGSHQRSCIGYAESADGITWGLPVGVRNPVLTPNTNADGSCGASSAWDCSRVGFPSVIYSKDDQGSPYYQMWYQAYGNAGTILRIGYVESTDGISWVRQQPGGAPLTSPVLTEGASGEWDDALVHAPSVLKDSSGYKMWYSGSSGSDTTDTLAVGYATSNDGITWTKDAANPVLPVGSEWDAKRTIFSRVFKHNGIYQLWYSGGPMPQSGVPLDQYKYQIGSAVSLDGVYWTKYTDNDGDTNTDPVFTYGLAGSFDSYAVYSGYPIEQSASPGTYWMFYSGFLNTGFLGKVGLTSSTQPSFVGTVPASLSVVRGDTLSVDLSVTDSDTSSLDALHAVWFIDQDLNNSGNTQDDVLGTVYADSAGQISLSTGTSSFSVGQHTLTIVVMDNGGLAITKTITLNVQNSTQTALTSISAAPVYGGAPVELTAAITLSTNGFMPSDLPTASDTVQFQRINDDQSFSNITDCGTGGGVGSGAPDGGVVVVNNNWQAVCMLSGWDAGAYTVRAVYSGSTNNAGSASAAGSVLISQAALTVTADVQTKVYGNADPALTYQITSGSLVGSDVLTGSLSRATGEAVGTYAINQNTLSASANYALTYTGASLAISARPLTVTADVQTKVYGNTDPALTYQITSGSLAIGDVLTGSLSRATGEAVGAYAINQNTLSASSNYALTYTGASLAISARPLTVTADAKSKVYGDTDPALTYQITSGSLAGSDVLTGSLSRATGEAVGAYAINQNTLNAGANYDLTYTGASLAIGARPLTVTADAKSKVYGDTDPALTYQITSGSLAIGDVLTGSLSRATGEAVGAYAINQNTLSASSNYTLNFASAPLTINKRALTIVVHNQTMSYAGTLPTLTGTTTGLVNGDTVAYSISTGVPASLPAGTYTDVIIAVVVGNAAANYTASVTNGTLTINKAGVELNNGGAAQVLGTEAGGSVTVEFALNTLSSGGTLTAGSTVNMLDTSSVVTKTCRDESLTSVLGGAAGACTLQGLTRAGSFSVQICYDGDANFTGGCFTSTQTVTVFAGPLAKVGLDNASTGQSVSVGQLFAPLIVWVTDTYDNPISNVPVMFTAYPSSMGASVGLAAELTDPSETQVATITDTDGLASVYATANSTAGSYRVIASFCAGNAAANDHIFCGDQDFTIPIFELSNTQ